MPESRFYLKPISKPNSDIWFSKQPMGISSISNIAHNMSLTEELNQKKSNHSARKIAIQTLLHANVSPTNVRQITGHKHTQLFKAYLHLSNEQQRTISNMLSTSALSHIDIIDEAPTSKSDFSSTVNFFLVTQLWQFSLMMLLFSTY